MKQILVAGLSLRVRARLQGGLEDVSITAARTAEQLPELLASQSFSALVVDETVAMGRCLELFQRLSGLRVGLRVLIARGPHPSLELRSLVEDHAVDVILQHPVDADELLKQLAQIGKRSAVRQPSLAPESNPALEKVWEKHKDLIFRRLDLLEALARKGEGPFAADELEEAQRAAHQLGGSLGSFGLDKATMLAREAEHLTAQRPPDCDRLQRLVQVLRSQVAARSSKQQRGDPILLYVSEDARLAEALEVECLLLSWRLQPCPDLGELTRLLDHPLARAVVLDRNAPTCARYPDLVEDLLADSLPCVLVEPDRSAQELMLDVLRGQDSASSGRPSAVLVVDDDPIVLKVVSTVLSKVDLRVETLESTLDFWDTIERVQPDLVILDVDLPPLGGVELCRAMRATRQYAAIPVMFQSSYAEPETIRRVFEAGADDYLVKPASGLELLTRVGNRLERFRQIASAPLATPGQGPLHTSLDQMFLRAARDNLAVSLACVQVPENGLSEAQQRLRNSLRNEDVVRTLGPAELVVGMLGVERDRAVERLRGILDGTVSLGVAEFPADARDYAGLVQQARDRRG